jgi:hypothetical protein
MAAFDPGAWRIAWERVKTSDERLGSDSVRTEEGCSSPLRWRNCPDARRMCRDLVETIFEVNPLGRSRVFLE